MYLNLRDLKNMKMKKIALFGATGKTGNHFLKLALEAGYEVKVLVRNPDKLKDKNDKLSVIKGDVLNQEDVETTVKDCDLVVSLFGHVKDSPAYLQTNGTQNIVKSMRANKLKKLVSLSGGGLPFPEKDEPKFIDKTIRFIMKVAFSKMLNDAIEHHKVLEKSNLDWVIVRGPRLTDDEKLGKYKIGWVGVNAGTKIARADLADFILKQLENNQFIKQMPFVSY